MSELDHNTVKKLNCDASAGLDSGYYPSPYAMTRVSDEQQCAMHALEAMEAMAQHHHTSPMKQVCLIEVNLLAS